MFKTRDRNYSSFIKLKETKTAVLIRSRAHRGSLYTFYTSELQLLNILVQT